MNTPARTNGLLSATNNLDHNRQHLFGPFVDFALLGGGSLVTLLLIRAAATNMGDTTSWSLALTLTLANLINHPHFAHSYQIFYSGFVSKCTSPGYDPSLRRRYVFAGVVAPLALLGFFSWSVLGGHVRALGIAANAMFFLVGWHYVKQGFGMAMVDAALKRRYYAASERRTLLINAYSLWVLSWLLANRYLAAKESVEYFGIAYMAFDVPALLFQVALATSALTSAACGWVLFARLRRGHGVAWNGLIAYATTLYAWLLIRDPVVLLWVPLFHSLQYLAVVWRYKLNESAPGAQAGRPGWLRFALFLVAGVGLGYYGFWFTPNWLAANVAYDREVFGPSLFFFLTWVFINVHHYLLDSVMWRKGNPDVARNLFQSGAPVTARPPPAGA